MQAKLADCIAQCPDLAGGPGSTGRALRETDMTTTDEMTDMNPRERALWLLARVGWTERHPVSHNWAVDYLIRWTNGQTTKGAAIFGPVGTGKTLFLSALQGRCGRIRTAEAWARLLRENSDAFWAECSATPAWDNLRYFLLDDVGAEPLVNAFGNKTCVVSEIILARYGAWCRDPRLKLFITSNLSAEEFRNRYGDRIVSRVRSCCETVAFSGADQRQPAAVPAESEAAEENEKWWQR